MATAKQGDKVKVHYTGKLEDGTVFDSSEEREPIEFTIGQQQVLEGLENEIPGMEVEETKDIVLSPENAYGHPRQDMVLEVPKSQFPDHITPEVGLNLQLSQQDGQSVIVTITNISDDKVELDGNHKLAGKTLYFNLKLVEIANDNEEEASNNEEEANNS